MSLLGKYLHRTIRFLGSYISDDLPCSCKRYKVKSAPLKRADNLNKLKR